MTAPRDPVEWGDALGLRPLSPAFVAVTRAIYGTPLTDDDRAILDPLTSGAAAPDGGTTDALIVAGRRSGKSEWAARVGVFEAIHGGHGVALAPGQVGLFGVTAPLREQAHETLGYVRGLAKHRLVRPFVVSDPDVGDGVEFRTRVEIKVRTFDSVGVRGPTWVGWVSEEHAFLPSEDSADPASRTIGAIEAGLAPLAGAPPRRIIRITSAFTFETLAYGLVRDNFGKAAAPTWVVQGSTADFNPHIDTRWLEARRRRDPATFAREFMSKWQAATTDSWFGVATVAGCVVKARTFLPWSPIHQYVITLDAAFTSDRAVITVGHYELREDGRTVVVQDALVVLTPHPGAPLSAETLVRAGEATCEEFHAGVLYADQYSFPALQALFGQVGVGLIERTWTGASKAPAFRRVRDAMGDGHVELLDDAALLSEFVNVQGTLLPGGGERIEARRGHDDIVASTVMMIDECMRRSPTKVGTAAGTGRVFDMENEMKRCLKKLWPATMSDFSPHELDLDAEELLTAEGLRKWHQRRNDT